MTTEHLFVGCALIVALIGGVTDVASHKIPNWLTYAAILIAIVGRGALQGWRGLASAVGGALIGGGVFLLFFLIHAMGAGDVKLITAVGALAGSSLSLQILLASAIAGGVLGLIVALWRRRLRATLVNVGSLIKFHATVGAEVHPTLNLSNPEAVRLPYGLAIAAGVLYSAVGFYCRGGL